jgi:hypothetical protein
MALSLILKKFGDLFISKKKKKKLFVQGHQLCQSFEFAQLLVDFG